jgi:hypothetical protein
MNAPSMIRRSFLLGASLSLAALPATAMTQGYSRAAARVLAAGRAASGGAGWNSLRGWHEVGTRSGVPYEAWLDPVRYGMRVETKTPAGREVHGFNGLGDWRITPAGAVTGIDVTNVRSPTRTEAFFDIYGFFFPGRFDASADYVGVRRIGRQAFEVVLVKPWNGEGRELWFDRRTHLLARMVERSSGMTWRLSDYRKAGPVKVAFRVELERGDGPLPYAPAKQIESLDFKPADRAIFSLPRLG